jgi:hypothetical protein
VLAIVVVRIYVRRSLVLKLKTSLFESLDNLLSVTKWDENVISKVCCDEEDGSVIQSAMII